MSFLKVRWNHGDEEALEIIKSLLIDKGEESLGHR